MKDCYDSSTTSGAYSLDALTAEEKAEFERALVESEALRDEVAGFDATAAALAMALEPVKPRPELKAALFARLDATPQLPAAGGAVPAAASSSSAEEAEPANSNVISLDRARRRRRPLMGLAAAAAAVVLFVGGAAIGDAAGIFGDRSSEQFAQLNAAADVVRTESELPDGGTASLIVSEDLALSAVVLNGLGDLPSDRTYQLWHVTEDGAASAGIVSADGGSAYLMLEGDYEPGETVAMTVEPRGGSQQPTTTPMIIAEQSA